MKALLALLIFPLALLAHCIYLSPEELQRANKGKHWCDPSEDLE